MTLYMMVTNDKYELPLIVSKSVDDIARFAGVSKKTIYSAIFKVEHGNRQRSSYIRINVD